MMFIDQIKNLYELISKEEFHNLMKELISIENELTDNELLFCLDILGEKFSKFYDDNELKVSEKDFIHNAMKRLTNFGNYERTIELTGLLFLFRIDVYYQFLTDTFGKHYFEPLVKQEILDTIKEYENAKK